MSDNPVEPAHVPVKPGSVQSIQEMSYLNERKSPIHPLDMALQNHIAKLTGGISPASISLAWMDWAMHLATSPGKQMELVGLLQRQAADWPLFLKERILQAAGVNSDHISNVDDQPRASDTRFADQAWAHWPYNVMSKAFLQSQDFWQQATSGVRGMTEHHEDVVNFMSRQLLDVVSPSNSPFLNPEVIEASKNSGGKNLASGFVHFLQDLGMEFPYNTEHDKDIEQPRYQPGHDVATTPGQVVFRNHMIELIQYAPQTSKVYAEPLLIVPSWIMKYYILDLSHHNSMVRFLVEQGHTVFIISWRNPDKDDRNLGMDDYVEQGLYAALSVVNNVTKGRAIHAVGYCLGGTLLAIGAAAIARENANSPVDHKPIAEIASVTLLAAQTDFSEPGELGLFIDESQLAMLDALMWKQGYLDGKQMSGSFQILNSRDLIWSKIMRDYQLGLRNEPNDLMSWNSDTTRLPYRMHSEYLKHLFLHNDLAKGHYEVHGKAIALNDIHVPMFVVGTAKDHVSPWRSVYKIHVLTDTPIEFILASGGHNAGVVSEPGHAHRTYQYLPESIRNKTYNDPDAWQAEAKTEQGSWWVYWQQWLKKHSDEKQIKALQPHTDSDLGAAPGTYVFEK
ncbi:PHA/PHB synthase family protein [Undibacterium sp. RuRC25W]|uniref:PHA/PHB synthase family protein n=1 Tax=Undibacterium sp. RuRC25W TaxID=3413047 RepID=UPI003BF31BF9